MLRVYIRTQVKATKTLEAVTCIAVRNLDSRLLCGKRQDQEFYTTHRRASRSANIGNNHGISVFFEITEEALAGGKSRQDSG